MLCLIRSPIVWNSILNRSVSSRMYLFFSLQKVIISYLPCTFCSICELERKKNNPNLESRRLFDQMTDDYLNVCFLRLIWKLRYLFFIWSDRITWIIARPIYCLKRLNISDFSDGFPLFLETSKLKLPKDLKKHFFHKNFFCCRF